MIAATLAAIVVGVAVAAAWDMLQNRKLEMRVRDSVSAPVWIDGRADVEPEQVVSALIQILDVVGVGGVFRERDSHHVYVLIEPWVTAGWRCKAVADRVVWMVPVGLSFAMTPRREDVPDECEVVGRSWMV